MVAELPQNHADNGELRTLVITLAERVGLAVVDPEHGPPNPIGLANLQPPPRMIAQAWVHALRARNRAFPDHLFADPAWDMLLDLYIARCDDAQICVSSLCIAANVPATTALRWIAVLEKGELATRSHDSGDGRRKLVSITDKGMAAMEVALGGAATSDKKLGVGRLHLVK